MAMWDFACSDPIDISVSNWIAGSIVVSGQPTRSVVVEVVASHRNAELVDQVQVAFEDGQLYVQGPRVPTFRRWQGLHLTIKAPPGSTCAARTVSADLSCVGDISAVSMHTASGDLTAASVGEVAMRSASGGALLNRVTGTLFVHTASGDVSATRTDGEVRINSASGDVAIGHSGGPVAVHTASGDVKLSAVGAGPVELAQHIGRSLRRRHAWPWRLLGPGSHSGDVRSELDAGDSGGQELGGGAGGRPARDVPHYERRHQDHQVWGGAERASARMKGASQLCVSSPAATISACPVSRLAVTLGVTVSVPPGTCTIQGIPRSAATPPLRSPQRQPLLLRRCHRTASSPTRARKPASRSHDRRVA